jgi:NDP-sugar pyrophosphorylase family protein
MTSEYVSRLQDFSCKEDGLIAVALCGGMGTRMREITQDEIPKSLVELNGKPLIDYSIDPLLEAGVDNFLFAAAHKSSEIEKYVRNKFGDRQGVLVSKGNVEGIVKQVKRALVDHNISKPLVIFDCDAVRYGLDFSKAYIFHCIKQSDITLVGTRVAHPKDSNFVVVMGENNEALMIFLNPENRFKEGAIIKCGMMICSQRATEILKCDDTIPNSWIGMVESLSTLNNNYIYVSQDILLYANINTPEELFDTERQLKELNRLRG